ncbi:GntR family transcriptional regulator [Hasllibacter halocynthiae]|uniref:GntR family transcriptional regulator n=1 Tax=Hasllibacter halocynthiae TaxID=595589 RepID=A0A2T0X930_9RHOB|nr:GntR family transcriptional regulator [Hasllibacter halocynthiae]PRY95452.1 GntR family transcriptional regulator [Hasllibacter halocynthiae]
MPDEAPPPSADPPLWQVVAAQITAEMAAGRLADGARLSPEREMAPAMGVAVGTLRRALADLEGRGLLERRQGSGNYVRHAGLGREVYGLFRLERADGVPGMPGADLLDVAEGRAPEGAPFGSATRIRRLRRIGGLHVAAEEIWLDAACGRPRAEELGDSLYLSYGAQLSVFVTRVEDRVTLGDMPGWAGLGAGRCGRVLRRSWAGGAVVEVSVTSFDPSLAHYVNRAARTAPPKGPA